MGILNSKNRTSLTAADLHADAQKKLEIIRNLVADFIDSDNLAELSSGQLRRASSTSAAYLRKGAVVAELQTLSGYPENAAQRMRLAADVEEAFDPFLAALADATRVAQMAIARIKLDGDDAARIVRRVATTYSRTPQGVGLRETVEELRAAQRRPARRKKPEPPPEKK